MYEILLRILVICIILLHIILLFQSFGFAKQINVVFMFFFIMFIVLLGPVLANLSDTHSIFVLTHTSSHTVITTPKLPTVDTLQNFKPVGIFDIVAYDLREASKNEKTVIDITNNEESVDVLKIVREQVNDTVKYVQYKYNKLAEEDPELLRTIKTMTCLTGIAVIIILIGNRQAIFEYLLPQWSPDGE